MQFFKASLFSLLAILLSSPARLAAQAEGKSQELVEFSSATEQGAIQLKWYTMADIDVVCFELERSSDGNTFLPIERVESDQVNSLPKMYEVTDANPIQGRSFYRLRLVDSSGKTTYSEKIAANFKTAKSLLTIQPNPAVSEVEIVSLASDDIVSKLKIIDSFGHIIVSYPWNEHDGLNRLQINVSDLAKGVYFVTLESGSEVSKIRMIKE